MEFTRKEYRLKDTDTLPSNGDLPMIFISKKPFHFVVSLAI